MSTNLKFLIAKLNPTTRRALEAAANLALSRSHFEVDIEHLLLALLDDSSSAMYIALKANDIAPAKLQETLEKDLSTLKSGNNRNPVLATNLVRLLEGAWLSISIEYGGTTLNSASLLAALRTADSLIQQLSSSSQLIKQLPPEGLWQQLPALVRHSSEAVPTEHFANSCDDTAESRQKTTTPNLDKYTIDLTEQARDGSIDRVLGRDEEIRQMIDILLRRRQNNPILTGEPGVGKTAVVEGLAIQIVNGNVPDPLRNVVLRTLDLGLLQAGASIKGEFENRLRGVIDEVKASIRPIILFIDEAHTMIGAGGTAGQNDAANLLKPALARGELRTIAATTWSEYKRYFEKDAALARRFQVVKIEEPDTDTAIQMLRGLVPTLESHHGVRILDAAVVDAVQLSARYINGRQLPDKCVSLLDTACARVALSLAAKPAAVVDVTNLLENLQREEVAILRDGMDTQTKRRVDAILLQREQLQNRLDKLQTDYEVQLKLVDEIRQLRLQIEDEDKQNSAPPNQAPRRSTNRARQRREQRLQEAIEYLRQRHREQPLVHECVDSGTIAEIVSSWTGIPLGRMIEDELTTIQQLDQLLMQRVIGQDHAIQLISQRIRISKAGLEDPSKPKGVFLLVGPSGVGKTETASALADVLYGGERNLITINMSEYQEAHSVAGLKGSPPGYVGYGEGGLLTEAVRRKPYSAVLLDEVEKAHPDVLELFFQVFDKGCLDDSEGNSVDFRNTVIILTSNVGTATIMSAFEHGVDVDGEQRQPTSADLIELIRKELQHHFKPAFLGRLSVIPYAPICDDVLKRIVALKLERVSKRIKSSLGSDFSFDQELVDQVARRCLDIDAGARNADTIINDILLTPISVQVLAAMSQKNPVTLINVAVADGAVDVSITHEELER